MKLKIKDNLHLEGNEIISYETRVATITKDGIISNGSYSSTTGKHIRYVAGILGLNVIKSKTRQPFYEFQLGIKINFRGSISKEGTRSILEYMRSGISLEAACASAWNELSKKDREKISSEFDDDLFKLCCDLDIGWLIA